MVDVKITDLTALGADVAAADRLEIEDDDAAAGSKSKKATASELVNATLVNAAGAVMETDYSSTNSILLATTANTPAALAIAASQFVGRKSTGNAGVLTAAEARTVLNVADGANNYSHPNHTGDVTSTGDGATVIADNAVTLAHMAHGTDGNLITYDATGAPAAVATGTSGQVLTSNGAGAAPTFQAASAGLTLATPQTPTSGSTVDFTSIPSGTTQITVSFHALTANADAQLGLRIGDSGGIETTGYNGPEESNRWELSASTIGASPWYGAAILTLVDSTNNIWSISSNIYNDADTPVGDQMGGSKALTAELDRVQVILAGSTFSSGTINIAYM